MRLEYREKEIQIDEKYLYLLSPPRLLYYDVKGYLKFTKGKRNGEYRNKQIHRVIRELENGHLKCNEIVHHSSENILDIRLNNLIVLFRGEHTRMHGTGRTHSEKVKLLLRRARLGTHLAAKTKEKISKQLKGKRTGKLNPFFGQRHTEEARQKMRSSYKKRKRG